MKPLKFVLPASLLLCSFTVFAQIEKPVPPAPPEQPVQPPLPPSPPSLHFKIDKQHSKQFQNFKKKQVPKQPEKPLLPPPSPTLLNER